MIAPERILVRGPNWLGDLAMSTPGFRALRAGFPTAHITLHVRQGLEGLLAGSPWFDEILPLRAQRAGFGAMRAEASALRASGRFDLGLCIPDSWSSLLLMRMAGVRRVAGYPRAGRGLLLSQRVPVPAEWGQRRMVARERFVLGLVAALGCPDQGTQLELFTTDPEEAAADAALESAAAAPVSRAEALVALAPGASYGPSKCWPAESFAQVGDQAARAGARVVLLGAPPEAALAQQVADAMQAPALVLAGQTDVGALKAVLRRCRLLIANDAGTRHVAVAFGVPSVVFVGPTSLEKTSLNLERVDVLETDVACRPCYRRVCPIDHRCMTRIEPERAVRAMLDVLGTVPEARARDLAPERAEARAKAKWRSEPR